MTTPTPEPFVCEAYGPDLPGNHCFFELGVRCRTLEECQARLAVERQRTYQRIQELAADSNDPTWAALADEFTSPDDLLGGMGGRTPDEDPGKDMNT